MNFEIGGAIMNIENIAVTTSIRERGRFIATYGAGRWRKVKGDARTNKMQTTRTAFALCLDDHGYPASLEAREIYPTLPTTDAEAGCLRVVDESGEDYLYPSRLFLALELPEEAERVLTVAPGVNASAR